MVLVEPDAVIAEAIEFFPGRDVLGIGPYGDLGFEVLVGQWIGQLVADLQMIELFAVGQEIKDEDFHYCPSPLPLTIPLRGSFPLPARGESPRTATRRGGRSGGG